MNITAQRDAQTKLTKNLLDMIILTILEKKPMHGYELMTTIRKSYGIWFGPSTIYPLLSQIEKKNYISSHWDMEVERPRKTYKLTDDGKRALELSTGTLKTICISMTSMAKLPNNFLQHEFQVIPQRPNH